MNLISSYTDLRNQLLCTIEDVAIAHEEGKITDEQYKELARNNYQIQRTLTFNIKYLELLEHKNEVLQVHS